MHVRERTASPGRSSSSAGTDRVTPGNLPATAVVLAVVVVLAVLSFVPAVRHQLALSFQRQPERYVELYLADADASRSCPDPGSAGDVRFDVRSHLAADTDLGWTVTARAGGQALAHGAGLVRTVPGGTSLVSTELAIPVTAVTYDLDVRLTGRPERLLVHCGAQS